MPQMRHRVEVQRDAGNVTDDVACTSPQALIAVRADDVLSVPMSFCVREAYFGAIEAEVGEAAW